MNQDGRKKKKSANDESESEIDDEDALKMALELAKREDKFTPTDVRLNEECLENLSLQHMRDLKSQTMTPGTLQISPRKGRNSANQQQRSRTPVPRRSAAPTVCPSTPRVANGKAKAKAPEQETARKSRRTPTAKGVAKGRETGETETGIPTDLAEPQGFAETQKTEEAENDKELAPAPEDPPERTANASDAESEGADSLPLTLSIETITAKQLGIMKADGGILFPKPDIPGVTDEKWAAMIKTLVEPLNLLHSMASGEGKVKDQELKSGASNLRKKASGAAKKAGLKQGDATNFSNKLKNVATLLEELKAFRTKVLSNKSALEGKELKADIESIWSRWAAFGATINLTNSAGEQEERTVKYVEFPDLWVRGWLSLGPSFFILSADLLALIPEWTAT